MIFVEHDPQPTTLPTSALVRVSLADRWGRGLYPQVPARGGRGGRTTGPRASSDTHRGASYWAEQGLSGIGSTDTQTETRSRVTTLS